MLISRGNSLIRIFARPILHRPRTELNRACTIATFFVNPSERHRVQAPCAKGWRKRVSWPVKSQWIRPRRAPDARVPGAGPLRCTKRTGIASACPLHWSSLPLNWLPRCPIGKGLNALFFQRAVDHPLRWKIEGGLGENDRLATSRLSCHPVTAFLPSDQASVPFTRLLALIACVDAVIDESISSRFK